MREFVDAGVPEWSGRDGWCQLAADVFDAAVGFARGPVHLNLPFREPLLGDSFLDQVSTDTLTRRANRVAVSKSAIDAISELCAGGNGVIVAGEGVAGSKHVLALAEESQWPLLADSRSGLQDSGSAICHADAILREGSVADGLRPRVVLQFGEGPASKVLNQFLHDGSTTVIQISDRPEERDPYRDVTSRMNADISEVAKLIRRNGL